MGSLGSLGTPRPPREDFFDWFGTSIRVEPNLTDSTLIAFLDDAAKVEAEGDEVAQAQLVMGFMREFIHPDDFDTYWQVGREQRQTVEDHMRVMYVLVEKAAERPTQRSSVSSVGPPASEDELTAASLRRATAGRPDLSRGLIDELNRRRAVEAQTAAG